jgi:hypothetical protein
MGKGLIGLVVVSMVFILSVGIANARHRNAFESDIRGYPGECKITSSDYFFLEIEGVSADTEYTCCIAYDDTEVYVVTRTSDEDGELKCGYTLVSPPFDGPVCTVYEGDTCLGVENADFISGVN